jgi:hypothetical protein
VPPYHVLISSPQNGQERFAHRVGLLRRIEARTGRPVVVYAANLNAPAGNSIDHTDLTPLAELTATLPGRAVDVLLHSPGGSAEAAERIVYLLRERFDSVRIIVPHTAFSAATMLATSADQLLLDDTSALGPIDPQIIFRDPQTGQFAAIPTQAILDGFQHAKESVRAEPDSLGVYLPLLNKLDLHLFEICKNAEKLSKRLVRQWLKKYLLKGEKNIDKRVAKVIKYLSSHGDRLSHSRPITLAELKDELKITNIVDMRSDPDLRVLVTELWTEIEYFVEATGTSKFFENAYGVGIRRVFQQVQQIQLIPSPQQEPQSAPVPPQTPPGTSPAQA